MKCVISDKETNYGFKGVPVDKEVTAFAKRYRDALGLKSTRGVLTAFLEMKKFGHNWESIKKKLVDELKAKNITF